MSERKSAAGATGKVLKKRAVGRQRDVSRTVKTLREQLTSTDGVPLPFQYELLINHARSQFSAAYVRPLLVALMAVAAVLWTNRMLIAVWALVVISAHVTSLFFYKRLIRAKQADISVAGWRSRLIFLDFVTGLTLGLLFVLPSDPNVATDVFQFSAMLILIAVTSMLSSNVPGAMIAGTMPITLTVAITFALKSISHPQTADHLLVLAGMATTVEVFFILLGYRLYQANLMQIEAKAEKDELIIELEEANNISDESRQRAEEANLAKSRFLATMSHELRTPLNAILGFSEVMQNELLGPLDNATYKGYVADIHESGRHLLNLINEILDLSRIEAGRHALNEEAVTLPYIVEDCAHMMNLRARNKGVILVEQYEENMPKIWADERAVRQVTLNLMSNAVKFTPAGGTITTKVGWTAGGGQYVSVKDTGPGIADEEIPIVLSAFGQGQAAIKSAEQGTGLGLSIVQALVAMHGGTFDLKSKLGQGTEVTFTIPKTRVMEVMPAINERTRRRPDAPTTLPVASRQMLQDMQRQASKRA
ncbi:MAG: ATP-binding protein [Ancalomicrobiaceae bacterium]|nr:ATP-binding protein [Ancalomicrobiaceae bacterium]